MSKLDTRAPLDRSPKKNWVERKGGLPMYIRRIANHLHAEKGMNISRAIATAVNVAKKMCASGDLNWPGVQQVNAKSRAEACAAVAHWESMKVSKVWISKSGSSKRKLTDEELIYEVVKRYFSKERREELRRQGKTDPHGGFPLEEAGDVENAVKAIGRAKNPAMEKKRIIAAAKKFGCMHYIPKEWLGKTVSKKRISDAEFDELVKSVDLSDADDPDTEEFTLEGDIAKADESKRLVFGWASVAKRADGTVVLDKQGDELHDLEAVEGVAYKFVLESRDGGEMHVRKGVSTLVESFVSTPEKREKMGIPDGVLPDGWWVGFKVADEEVWKGVKSGKYKMFSVHGTGIRQEFADA